MAIPPETDLVASEPSDAVVRTRSRSARLRPVIWPGYSVGALLVLTPVLDNAISVWPLRLGEVAWRFGAVGLFSRTLVSPLLGLLLLLAVSLLAEHRVFTRIIAIISLVAAAKTVIVLGLFALDAVEMRAQIDAGALRAFDLATVSAAFRYVLFLVVTLVFAASAWEASKRSLGTHKKREPRPLIGSRRGRMAEG
jgi:hypothetical protein